VAKIAREGHNKGLSPAEIFPQIEIVTGPDRGPAPPSPGGGGDFHQDSLRNLASQIGRLRQRGSDEDRVIYLLMSWDETPLADFRKL
jgi:hypothetical protein